MVRRRLSSLFLGVVWVLMFSPLRASVSDEDYLIWIPRSASADPLYRVIIAGKVGYIDGSGKIVVPPVLVFGESNTGDEFHNGLLEIAAMSGVYVDRTGKKVISGLYRGWDFSEGLAVAMKEPGGEWGYINTRGEFAIGPRFPSYPRGFVSSFSNGLAEIEVDGRTGYVDHTGSFVIPPTFGFGSSFHEGFARVVEKHPCAYPETEGNVMLVAQAANANSKELAPCKYSFIDKTGSVQWKDSYDDALDFSEGLAPVRIGKLWGYVGRHGEMAIPPKFETATPFSDALALVSENELYGYIDHAGHYVISPRYKNAENFSDGYAVIGEPPWKYWYIDHQGKQAFGTGFALASPFFKGVAHVKLFSSTEQHGRVGSFAYIDRTGRIIFTEER